MAKSTDSIPPDGRPYHQQPQWRNDFPIDWPQDELVARRDFTKFLVLTSFAFVVGQAWIVFENWWRRRRGQLPIRKIARVDELAVGATRLFTYPDPIDRCLLIRTGADRFVAYNQKCTHLGCAVTPTARGLHCPCHNGWFDTATGVPTAGPPSRPLPRITLQIRDGILYATGVA
jgi:Rieske Fe-S protein